MRLPYTDASHAREAIPYIDCGTAEPPEHITWLNRPNGIATGLAALTLLKYPATLGAPFLTEAPW